MKDVRRTDISWVGEEVADYEVLDELATAEGKSVPEIIKKLIRQSVK
jgi:hypothetical protein